MMYSKVVVELFILGRHHFQVVDGIQSHVIETFYVLVLTAALGSH